MSSLSLLETDYKYDDYGRDSGYCKHCSESAFEKCNDEGMSETSSKEYPVRVKKKVRERRVENYRHKRQKIMKNAISWWRFFCFFTGTEERDEPTNNYTFIPFLSIMPCINNIFLLFLFMIFKATSRDTSCTYFYLRYCRFRKCRFRKCLVNTAQISCEEIVKTNRRFFLYIKIATLEA